MSRTHLLALSALALLVGGCGGDRAAPVAADRASTPAPSTPAVTPSVTSNPSPATPSHTSSPRSQKARAGRGAAPQPLVSGGRRPARASSSSSTPESHLLTDVTLPPVGRGSAAWTIRATGVETGRPVGVCQKTLLVDLGALAAVRRVLVGPDDSGLRARQVVGRFADRKSAWRAHQVLTAWRADCADRLDRPRPRVAALQSVELASAAGDHYLASYGARSGTATGRIATGLGIVRQGRWLTVVELRAPAADWPSDRDPTRQSVIRIAQTF